jgi:hypothetical protein
MNPHADIDSVSGDFPILGSEKFTIRQMDGLIREIIQVLERCSKLETIFSVEERSDNEYLLDRVLRYLATFETSEEEIHKAMLLLLRKRLATPYNLEMLLRMVDTDIQTGEIRCIAFALLGRLVQMDFVWGLKMKDGSYFATSCIVACSKALENETNEDCNNHHTERSCDCAFNAGVLLDMAMNMTKDAPATVIERVHSFNWAQILSKAKTKANELIAESNKWFICLYAFCMDVLKENVDHSLAREFVRKLEMCHDFFRGTLEDLVRLTRSLPSATKEEIGGLLYCLNLIRNVLRIYFTSLTPPPNDPKMDVLVRLAHQTLEEARPSVMAALQDPVSPFEIDEYDELFLHTDAQQWAGLKTLSDLQRRQRFEAAFTDHESNHKASRRGMKKSIKNCNEQSFGIDEVCTNCHLLESKMGEGETLSKCGWCKQVTYCSRECQKQHWNKAHKKECAGRKK